MATPEAAPQTQSSQEVRRILKQATYFVIFAVPNPSSLSVGHPLLPFIPQLIYGIDVTEVPHRFSSSASSPTAENGFRLHKTIGTKQIAKQQFKLSLMPNNFEAGPGRIPPPTVLLPFLVQRFWMHDGHFNFLDGQDAGLRLVAAGGFFPAPSGLGVYAGAVAEVIEGLGQLQGLMGNVVINGITTPPDQFANLFTFRVVDPTGKLQGTSLPPVEAEEPDPDYTDSSILNLMAEVHPDNPIVIEPLTNSSKQQVHLLERLRLVNTNLDVGPGYLKADNVEGEVVGERRTTFVFNPNDSLDTIPLYSTNSEFTFFTGSRQPIGTLQVDLFEGRAFRTLSPDLSHPYFRIAGYGFYGKGTGQFKNIEGMLTMNGALSLTPGVTSSMYTLRILDPHGRFRALWS